MGHYQDDYNHAAAGLSDYFGQPISYTDPSLSRSVYFEAEVFPEKTVRRQNNHGWYVAQSREITFLVDDLMSPRLDGTFTIGGLKYSVESIGDLNGKRKKVDLLRVSASEVNRPGYRGVR